MPLIGKTPLSFYPGMRLGAKISGQPLAQFENGGFENDFDNWTLINEAVSPGGVVPGLLNNIAGCPIPPDPTPTPFQSPGQAPLPRVNETLVTIQSGPYSIAGRNYPGSPTGGKWAKLESAGTTGSYEQMYGPALYSNNPVIAAVGDRISFNWAAFGVNDAYNVLAYIIDPNQSCRSFIMVDETGATAREDKPWTTVYKVIQPGEAGNYYFVFICGSYDASGGTALGSILGVDDVKIEKAGKY